MTSKRLIVVCSAIIVLVVGFWLWPRLPDPPVVSEAEISAIEAKLANRGLTDQLDLSDDSIFSFSFLPKVPWPNDESYVMVVTVIPEGKPYENSISTSLMRCTSRKSVVMDFKKDGKIQKYSPPQPASSDKRCYYYTVLRGSEIVFDGRCRLEVMLLRPDESQTENYGQFSWMISTCVYRHELVISR